MLRVVIVETKEIAKEILYDLQDVLENYDWEFHCYLNLSVFVNNENPKNVDILVLPKRYNKQRVYRAIVEPYPNMIVICTCDNTQDGMIHQILYINKDNIESELKKYKFKITEQLKGREVLYFQYNQVKVPIKIMDIYYLEKENKLVVYHTKRGIFKERDSLYIKEAQFQSYGFLRVHGSLLVNIKMIEKIDGNTIVLKDQQQLPISRSRKKEVMEMMKAFHQ